MMLASATLLTLSPSVYAAPQAGAPVASSATDGTNSSSYWAVVTGNAVNVRSGPSAQSAYAFGKLKQGDFVHVLKEEYGWARVQTQGNAFGDVCAFVPADRRVTLSADRTTATVGARTELRAPNVEAGSSPDKSWKQIGFADAGTTLAVLGTADGEKESVYKVKVPATAEAWINMQFLRRASDAETAMANAATANSVTTATTTVAAAPAPAGVVTPVNQPNAGAPAPTPVTPDIGSSTTTTATSSAGSPAIPPLLGPKPVNAATTEGTTAPGTVVTTTVTTTRTTTPKWVSSRATFDDLEQQFKAVRSQPDAGAEFEALKAKYEDLAAQDGSAGSVKGVAGARAQQLTLLLETQSEVQKLERTKASLDTNKKGIADLILNIQRRADFTAIGILNASAVYDGQRLPELYRICDPMTSATIAYVEPNADIAMAPMIGTLVGVKGGKQFDPALRLTVISPLSIDILTQRDTPQVTKTEATRPVEDAGKFVPATTAPEAPSPESALCPEDFTPARGATP